MAVDSSSRTLIGRLWRAGLLLVVAVALVVHLVAGWVFSGRIIDEAFTPPADVEFGQIEASSLPLTPVEYSSPVGAIDAWFAEGNRSQWVVHVHGKGASLEEAVPLAEGLAVAGYSQLIIGYRNDAGQPPDPSGYYGYGLTEHADLAGAVDWATENGAEEIAIVGYSTGGAIALSYLYKNPNAPVRSLVLDAPNADMAATIDLAATQEELVLGIPVPFTVTEFARMLASLRASINWESLDYVRRLDGLSVPALVFHGTEDDTVPIETSREMASVRPQLIDLVEVDGAGHVASRDVAGDAYDQRVLAFLEAHWR